MGAGMGAETRTIIKRRMEGKESPVIVEVGLKTWEKGQRQRVTNNHSRKPTPQRGCRIVRKTRAQGREARDRIGERGRGANKRKKPQKSYRRGVENGGDSGGRRKNVDNRVMVQWISTQDI